MKYTIFTLLTIFVTLGVQAQDSLGFSFKNEIFPVYSNVKHKLGEGLAFEIQKDLVSSRSKIAVGYSKLTFGEHTARNMEVVFYKESEKDQFVHVDLGFGFFVREWSDIIRDDLSTDLVKHKSMTTGYVVSLGAKANITNSVAFSTRVLFNNNIDFDLTYSLRPGIIISI